MCMALSVLKALYHLLDSSPDLYSVELSFLMMCMALSVLKALYHLLLARHFFIHDVSSSMIISTLLLSSLTASQSSARQSLAEGLLSGSVLSSLAMRCLAGCDVWLSCSMLRS